LYSRAEHHELNFGGLCSFVSYQEVKNESLYYQLRFLISKTRPSLTYSGREILIKELEKDFEMAVNSFISDVKEKWSLKNRIDALIGSIFIKPIENFVNWLKK
jgi:hypothetical protein